MAKVETSFTMSTTATNGKKSTKSVTNINENASNGAIRNLAAALNNITTNTLGTVAKVSKEEIEAGTYYDLTITLEKNNDSQNAITIDGNNATVDYSKIGDISDLTQMPSITLSTKLDGNNIGVQYNLKPRGYLPGMIVNLDGFKLHLTNPGDGVSDTSAIEVVIQEGIYNNKRYNGATVTIRFF